MLVEKVSLQQDVLSFASIVLVLEYLGLVAKVVTGGVLAHEQESEFVVFKPARAIIPGGKYTECGAHEDERVGE